MTKYWGDHPPVHMMVAAYFDIKPKSGSLSKKPEGNDLSELLGMFPLEENPEWIPKV